MTPEFTLVYSPSSDYPFFTCKLLLPASAEIASIRAWLEQKNAVITNQQKNQNCWIIRFETKNQKLVSTLNNHRKALSLAAQGKGDRMQKVQNNKTEPGSSIFPKGYNPVFGWVPSLQ